MDKKPIVKLDNRNYEYLNENRMFYMDNRVKLCLLKFHKRDKKENSNYCKLNKQ